MVLQFSSSTSSMVLFCLLGFLFSISSFILHGKFQHQWTINMLIGEPVSRVHGSLNLM